MRYTNKLHLLLLHLLIVAAGLTVVGCQKDSPRSTKGGSPDPAPLDENTTPDPQPGEQPDPVSAPTPTPTYHSFDLQDSDFRSGQGCVDVAKLYEWLRTLPPISSVRESTVDLVFEPQNPRSSMPTERFDLFLANTNFKFAERSIDMFSKSLPTVEQTGCQSLKFTAERGGSANFPITSWLGNEITFGSASSKQTIRIDGPRSLTITRVYNAVDLCLENSSYPVRKTEAWRWDDGQVLSTIPAQLSSIYLRKLASSLETRPPSVDTLLPSLPETGLVEVAPLVTREILASPIATRLNLCPVSP